MPKRINNKCDKGNNKLFASRPVTVMNCLTRLSSTSHKASSIVALVTSLVPLGSQDHHTLSPLKRLVTN